MRVLFDSQIFCHQRFGGVSRYVASTALEMAGMDDVTPLIVAPLHFNEYLDRLPRSLVFGRRVRWLERGGPLAYAAGYSYGRIIGRRFRPDIVHNTYYVPTGRLPGARQILTVYDMIHERYPNYVPASGLIARWKATCVSRADHVICISENTRRDLLNTYAIPEERVSVTHLGCDPLTDLQGKEEPGIFRRRVVGADAPYILFVGSRTGYKNFSGLLSAYKASNWLRSNFFLVCFGGGGLTSAEKTAIADAGVEERIKHVSGSDSVLADCYRHASLFVCPSQYEGFGLPPLEAMSLGCPVVCSNSSSLPEVVGDAALLFNPMDSDSIRDVLETVLNSQDLRAKLVVRGQTRYRNFSWTDCARKTVDIYRSTLNW